MKGLTGAQPHCWTLLIAQWTLHAGHWTLPRNGHTYNPVFGQIDTPSLQNLLYPDKKENQIFLIYQEIQNGATAESNMTNGLLIYGEIFAHFLIYLEALPHHV
jgi:hypothetical protein